MEAKYIGDNAMKYKLFSLNDMVKLSSNEELSEPYIRYLCGLNSEQQYRHQEILDVQSLHLLDHGKEDHGKHFRVIAGTVVMEVTKLIMLC